MKFGYCIMDAKTGKCIKQYEIPYPDPDLVKTHEEFVKWCEDHLTKEFEKVK